eukprot:TRINITY_DN8454_c0_g1_i1.p1 TRINITY_DN8454_c0_g1~~TRINITY_DN8454_c0_g1_i1.p1  ORF type:complete len:282 (-),score=10.58 TRINITY_DN8454_c0_g1_i1:369-1214(-)
MVGLLIDLIAFAIPLPIYALFVTHFFAGLTSSFYAMAFAYVADCSTPVDRAKNFGLIGATVGLSLVWAPAASGFLAQEFGFSLVLWISAGFIATDFAYTFFILPESKVTKETSKFPWKRCNPFHSFGMLAVNKLVLGVAFVYIITFIGEEGVLDIVVLFLKKRYDYGPLKIGIAASVLGITYASSQAFFLRFMVKRFGEPVSIIFGLVIDVTSIWMYAFAPEGWMLYPLFVFRSMALIVGPVIQGFISRHFASDKQGELLGALAGLKVLLLIILLFCCQSD